MLGDEASLTPSRPLGLRDQPFSLPVENRRTPVLLAFADRDEVRVKLSWPAGFEPDVLPEAGTLLNGAGAFAARLEVDASARALVYERRLDTLHREYATGKPYHELRELYGAAGKSDAQILVLVRR